MSAHKLIIKDAVWQLIGRVISALCGFVVIKIITPYLGPLQYGDYSTILKYFAIRSALADFGLYVIAVKQLGVIKNNLDDLKKGDENYNNTFNKLKSKFGKFIGTRIFIMSIVYVTALILAYFLPAYTSNIYLIRGLPIGMLFSASFMTAGILQVPLQIFWKMKQLSVGLIFARISQLTILVITIFVLFKGIKFDGSSHSIIAFMLIMFSVLASGITQGFYVRHKSKKYLPIKIEFDFQFIKQTLKENRQYGLSYYLSSFHTLIVLVFLSIFFPTSQGYEYTGVRALALAMVEILIIIPSALGNSMLHKVGGSKHFDKHKSFGNFMTLIFRIGGLVFVNFFLFNTEIITLIGTESYIGTSFANPGANTILPFLAIVLRLSFIKQVFNYIFVAHEHQNILLKINLIGVITGLSIGLYAIPKFGIQGGIVTQIILEIMFVSGAIRVSIQKKLFPTIPRKKLALLISNITIFCLLGRFFIDTQTHGRTYFFIVAIIFNILLIGTSLPIIKKIARGLSVEKAINNKI